MSDLTDTERMGWLVAEKMVERLNAAEGLLREARDYLPEATGIIEDVDAHFERYDNPAHTAGGTR